MSIAVARLGPADVRPIPALNRLFGEAFGEPATYGADPPAEAYLQDLLGRPHIVVLTA